MHFVFALLCVLSLGWLLLRATRESRRRRWRALPFPPEWRTVLERNLPFYTALPPGLREELHGYIHVFLREKNIEGCGGLALTDEIRITVAGQACILLLNRPTKFYPRLESVCVYPSSFVVEETRDGRGNVTHQDVRLGESWGAGTVVLAWDDTLRGGRVPGDGHNVALHEFAHQLDQEDGAADGTPMLGRSDRYRSWVRVFSREFRDLQKKVDLGLHTLMDEYGATDEAEFFAVATEVFYEKPAEMQDSHPRLYEELKSYYRVDPAEWRSQEGAS